MNWTNITTPEQLNEIDLFSEQTAVLIFKHSTRCSISVAALNRIERNWNEEAQNKLKVYYLDLLRYRNISDEIAQRYNIIHQSPQALIIKNGKCIFSQTHSEIRLQDLISLA